MNKYWIFAERNSPSDEHLVCIEILEEEGILVSTHDVIAEMEGAKAVFEVLAVAKGHFYAFVRKGERIQVGFPIGLISSAQLSEGEIRELKLELTEQYKKTVSGSSEMKNMSASAMKIFADLDEETKEKISNYFREFGFVREIDLIKKLNSLQNKEMRLSQRGVEKWKQRLSETQDLPSIFFVGGGFGAIQTLDILLKNQEYHLSGYFSDVNSNVLDEIDVPRLGTCTAKDYRAFIDKKARQNFVITVGASPKFRFDQFTILSQLGVNLPNIIHPSTVIGENVEMGEGNLIFANVHIGADSKVGNSNFISSNSTLEHHNILGSGNCFGPQIATSGNVRIGDRCRFGSGIIVEPNNQIASEVTIASGVTITFNVDKECTVKAVSNLKVTRNK